MSVENDAPENDSPRDNRLTEDGQDEPKAEAKSLVQESLFEEEETKNKSALATED